MITLLKAYWKPLAMLVAVVLLCAGFYMMGSSLANAQWLAKWSQRDAADAQAAQAFTEQQRRIELQRQGEIDAIQEQAQQDIAKAQRNAAIAAAESERLQNGIADAITRLQADSSHTSTATSSKTRASTSLLLTELFREIDTAASHYAAEADRARGAGLRCEAAYDAVRATQKK